MPLYICSTQKDALDQPAKEKIANAITDIHCSVTGAPASFVHAVFFEDHPQFSPGDKTLLVRGTIRRGRSDAQKSEIAKKIKSSLAELGGAEAQQVDALIRETPASWVMEGGEIMPEPGEEAEWFATQEARRQGEQL